MKWLQIKDGFVYADVSYMTENIRKAAAQSIEVVSAPDNIFPGWGYDEDASGDARFIKPTAPEGWIYDDSTGTFYDPDLTVDTSSESVSTDDLLEMIVDLEYRLTVLDMKGESNA